MHQGISTTPGALADPHTADLFAGLTIRPGQVIGYHETGRRKGQPIYVIGGGSGEGEGGGDAGGGTGTDTGGAGTGSDTSTTSTTSTTGEGGSSTGGDAGGTGTTTTDVKPALPDGTKVSGRQNDKPADTSGQGGQGTKTGTGSGGGTATPDKVEDLPDWAQKRIKELADAEAKSRINAKTEAAKEARDALVTDIAKALGIGKDGSDEEPPDPAKLTAELTRRDVLLKEKTVELAVHDLAGKHDGDASALLDSRTFAQKIHKLDPEGSDFNTKLGELIKKQVAEDPKFRAAQAVKPVAPSGGEFTGGPGSTTDDESKSVDDFRAERRKTRAGAGGNS